MDQADKDYDELMSAIGEIQGAMQFQILAAAYRGECVREILSTESLDLQGIADRANDYPAALQTYIDLANRLNELLHDSNLRLRQALAQLVNEGWIDRLDPPYDMEEQP